jgi:hypothetical protein
MARILLIVTGVALLTAAIAVAISVRSFARDSEKADGVVARLNAGGSHPQIEFTTASGLKVSYPQGGLIFGYQPGQKVGVLYGPDNPQQSARLDAVGALWGTPIILSIVAMFLIASGMLMKPVLRSSRTTIEPAQRGEGK